MRIDHQHTFAASHGERTRGLAAMAKELTIPRNVRLGEKNNKALAKAPTLSPNCSVANNMGRVPHGINKVNKAASAIISDTPTFFGAISPAIANKVAE